ncbi:3'-5' exonuclease DinG [Pleomorphomonas sp. T1.2MG-36]|uniref:DNA polymerase III subunit epsilon n=1 Tax=Pleomorphomonas sp. T1.2MG-36 TaxID=3041167 RepID=UPI0024773468|nr:DNA polymerase III subunit epsilon [Pleomorphomonas sp. T1.2MG-36]CAI9414784.1 3'-5' exonuclease DinG [Pleomorphomonas sp. T1.2MG-36]
MREIVFDTETTGLDPKTGDRLVEIGCVEVVNRFPTGRNFHVYINPGRSVPKEAFDVHGLSDEFLADKPRFDEIADGFVAFVGEAHLVAHNASFDMGFINFELKASGRPVFGNERVVDTLMMARRKHPGAPASLDALCNRYGIDRSRRIKHGALLDAELLAEVYLELTGGRQAGLDLTVSVQDASTGDTGGRVALRPRPAPLPSRLSASEAEAHAAFIAAIGEKALWNTYLDNGEQAETA